MSEKTSRANPRKKETVNKLVDLAKNYPIVGVVNMENLPTPQLQRMREQLRGKVELFMTKKRVIKKAIDKLKDKPGFEKIKEYLKGMPALLFTKENPFSLFKTLKKSKSKAPAKAGQTAPSDIIIPAGPTPFAPGPVIGELGALGVKASVEGGKIAIAKDTKVCSEGDEISEKLAAMLTRLGIEPMEIGLDIVAVYEKGTIYTKKILDVDEEQFLADVMHTASQAFNLAMEAGYTTKETIEPMIQKAFRGAKAVALESEFMADAVAEELLGKAERQMLALKSQIPELPKAEAKTEEKPKEEPKKEEKKTEAPKEEPKKEEPTTEEKPKQESKPEQGGAKKEEAHPKQGDVSQKDAEKLAKELQEKGTLR